MKTIKKLIAIVVLILLIVASSLFGMAYLSYIEAKKTLAVEDMYEYVTSNTRTYTYIEDIDEDFLNAIVAIEDQRFYTRYGIDFIALGRAMLTNIASGSLVEGGSTITQQLIKNVYYGYDRGFIDKLAEYFFIYVVEDTYDKDEILEMYVNYIYYGDGYYNIYDACMGYFGKEPSDLTVYEASLLASIPNSPANYQLSNNNPNTYERQRQVLEAMLEMGYIDQDEYDAAIAEQPTF